MAYILSIINSDVEFRNIERNPIEDYSMQLSAPDINIRAVNAVHSEQYEITVNQVGGFGGIPEAPLDGKLYGRKNKEWSRAAEPAEVAEAISQTLEIAEEEIAAARAYADSVAEAAYQAGKQDLEDAQEIMEAVTERIDNRLTEVDTELTGKLEEAKDRIANAEENISDAQINIDKAEANITLQAERLDVAEGTLTDVGLRVDAAEGAIDAQATHIDTLEGTVSDVGLRLDAAEGTISIHNNRLDETEGSVTVMEQKWDNVEATITTTVATQIATSGSTINTGVEQIVDGKAGVIEQNAVKTVEENMDGYITTNTHFSQLRQDTEGIKATVGDATNGLVKKVSVLEQTSDNIALRVTDAEQALDDGHGGLLSVGEIKVTADTISSVVTNGDNYAAIIARINAATGASEVMLDADKIYLLGETVAERLTAIEAVIGNLSVVNTSVEGTIGCYGRSDGEHTEAELLQMLLDGEITKERYDSYKLTTKWQLKNDGTGSLANGNITWDQNGNAAFTGNIVANSLTLGANVKIDYNTHIDNTPNLGVFISKDGVIGSTPSEGSIGFVVSSQGLLQASSAIIYGTIGASAGKIGGWDIINNYLHSSFATTSGNGTTHLSLHPGMESGQLASNNGIKSYTVVTTGTDPVPGTYTHYWLKADGSGEIANGSLTWSKYGVITLSNLNGSVILSNSGETLDQLLAVVSSVANMFEWDNDPSSSGYGSIRTKRVLDPITGKWTSPNFYTYGEITAGGVGTGGGGGGGIVALYAKTSGNDVRLYDTDTMVAKFGIKVNGNFVTPTNGVFDISTSGGTVTGATIGGTPVTLSSGVLQFPAYPTVPTALSQLSADATHRLVTDTQITAWNSKQAAISDLATIRSNAANGQTAYSSLGNYLPLTGGTLSASENILSLNSSSSNAWMYFKTSSVNKAAIGYYAGMAFISNEATYARIGVTNDGTPQYWNNSTGGSGHQFTLYHSGNLTAATLGALTTSAAAATYLPLSGGLLSGASYGLLGLDSTHQTSYSGMLEFRNKGTLWGRLSCVGQDNLCFTNVAWSANYTIYHSGNSNNTSTPWSCSNLTASGNVVASGEVTAGSDKRWKHNITPVVNGIDAIMKLNPCTWEWNSDNHKGSGLIAQDVQSVIPHLVKTDGEGYLHLTYDGLHAYEISAIQSHETRVQYLERRVKELERQLNINA